jgi:hypothetical protein
VIEWCLADLDGQIEATNDVLVRLGLIQRRVVLRDCLRKQYRARRTVVGLPPRARTIDGLAGWVMLPWSRPARGALPRGSEAQRRHAGRSVISSAVLASIQIESLTALGSNARIHFEI